ncbi:hypothetical protein SAMN04487914_12365 [Arthrobacter sp. ok909]|uniref:hypothetical protein n=1 Tax=Arthrobacter sp. ok909 TaxID=1761746 RepID=UPI0008812085|nr:hypothetical protein [Arthrobacter sp. ok909]SDP65273.1 hypothetical protein SAMN04487914_12365 [Arthrobacter sp. ok909]
MSESTQSSPERSPFTKPGFIISAALVVALIAAVVVIFFLPKADSTAQPAPASSAAGASSAPSKSADAAGKSFCGLPSSTERALGAAPKSKWELVGKMAAPTDPKTFGPGVTDGDGFRTCFANSPTGALYAAANMIALGSSGTQDELKLADKLLVPGPGRDAAIKAAKARTSTAGSGETAQISGFLVKSCSPAEADVDLAIKLPNGALAHSVLSLRWVAGDWRVKAADDGQVFNGVAQLSDLSGFILWSGV